MFLYGYQHALWSEPGESNGLSRPAAMLRVFILALPFVSMLGNAPADLWLSMISLGFLIRSAVRRDWAWVNQKWLLWTLVFWVWAVACSLISDWPSESLNDSLAWFRFPIFAVALAEIFRRQTGLLRQFALSMAVAVVFVATYLVVARLSDNTAVRVSGPFGMERPGWYLLGFGLPVILLTRFSVLYTSTARRLQLLMALLLIVAMVASYQIYVTFALLFGLLIYSALTFTRSYQEWALLCLGVLLVGTMLSVNDVLHERFTAEVLRGLPWRETSRYFNYWVGGLVTAFDNPIVGVGPNNYDFNCNQVVAAQGGQAMGFSPNNPLDGCLNHPHQRYIQIAAETGVIGLALFVMAGCSLLAAAASACMKRAGALAINAMAFSLLMVNFWPLSTFSEAFGQKLNFFYWFHVAWALALLDRGRADNGDAQEP